MKLKLKQVKESVSIPVIGNGDVTSREIAKQRLEQSGVDAIMIGRGAFGNPWIFREINSALRGEGIPEVSNKEKVVMCLRHYELAIKLKEMGIEETQGSISNKISRGTFSFTFFMQCMEALEIKEIRLD